MNSSSAVNAHRPLKLKQHLPLTERREAPLARTSSNRGLRAQPTLRTYVEPAADGFQKTSCLNDTLTFSTPGGETEVMKVKAAHVGMALHLAWASATVSISGGAASNPSSSPPLRNS